MKYFHLFFTLIISSQIYAQNIPSGAAVINSTEMEEEKIFTKTENPVTYPGGEKKLFTYIESNLDKQSIINAGASKGDYVIMLRFIVRKDSVAYDFFGESLTYNIEDEIIRILKTIPKWNPAKQNGRQVTAYHRMKFSLNLK